MKKKNKKQIYAITEFKDGKFTAIASDETTDRVGDKLKSTDWNLTNYKKNPILQAGHDYRPQYTIGIAENIKVEGKKLTFEPKFHEITSLAKDIKKMFEEGFLKAWSVGFIPGFQEDEKNELLEISAVAVPANPNALTVVKSISEEEVNEIKQWIDNKKDDVLDNKNQEEEVQELDKNKEKDNNISEEEKSNTEEVSNANNNVDNKIEDKKEHEEKSPACRMEGESKEDCVDRKIPELIDDEEMEQDQAVAVANEMCTTACSEKDEKDDMKSVISFDVHGESSLLDIDAEWNASEEVNKVSGNEVKLKKMHTWVDNKNEDFNSTEQKWYKLPHHSGDGDQPVIWKGVASAMGALLGARGGIDIPDKDRKGVYNHLAKHYSEFDKKPPEFKDYSEDEIDDMFSEFAQLIDKLRMGVNERKDFEDFEEKEGRILSKKNRKVINEAKDSLKQTISILDNLLEISETDSNSDEKREVNNKIQFEKENNKKSLKKKQKEEDLELRIARRVLQGIVKNGNNALRTLKNKK